MAPLSHAAPRPARSLRRLPAALSRRLAPLPSLQPGKRRAASPGLARHRGRASRERRGPRGNAAPAAAAPRCTPLLPPQLGRPPALRGCYLRPHRSGRHPAAHLRIPPAPFAAAGAIAGPRAERGRPPASARLYLRGASAVSLTSSPAPRRGCWLKATPSFRKKCPPAVLKL